MADFCLAGGTTVTTTPTGYPEAGELWLPAPQSQALTPACQMELTAGNSGLHTGLLQTGSEQTHLLQLPAPTALT